MTLAIIATATTLVLPSIGSSYDRIRLRSFSQELAREVRSVRSVAQTDGRVWSLVFTEVMGYIRAGNTVEREIGYPDGIQVTSDTGQVLLFLPSGQIAGNRTIWISTQSGQTRRLEVDALSGRLQFSESEP